MPFTGARQVKMNCKALAAVAMAGSMLLASSVLAANGQNMPGVTDTTIKIGQTLPYSGPASNYGRELGGTAIAFFKMINDQGGVNGRKIELISLDDAYSPPRTVEQVRKLVEQEEVLLIYGTLGTATNTAIHKYVNAKKVPVLFISSAADKWNQPDKYPWIMSGMLSSSAESAIYAKYVQDLNPNAKIGVLYHNDEFGRDYLVGLKKALGDKAGMIVAEASYESADPTVDSQVISLKSSGADTLINFAMAKHASQAIKKAAQLGWKPLHIVYSGSANVSAVLEPAGLENSVGIVSVTYYKEPADPQWKDDQAVQKYRAFMQQYAPQLNPDEFGNVFAYNIAHMMLQVLKQSGDDLSRENVMRQAANLKDVELPLALPGVRVNTSPTDYLPIKQARLKRFDGTSFVPFGEVLGN